MDKAKAQEIVEAARFPADVADQVTDVIVQLWETFVAEDATLVEVNPLVKDPQGKIIALDGKVTLDDNASFRQPKQAELVDKAAENPLEAKAKERTSTSVGRSGRHHRQRCRLVIRWTCGLRRREARRGQAGQLPDIGSGAPPR